MVEVGENTNELPGILNLLNQFLMFRWKKEKEEIWHVCVE